MASRLGVGLTGLILVSLPSLGSAQEPPGDPQASDTVPLVFEREVFYYPEFERRDPFQPLTGNLDGPRFEELRLLGIVLSADPARSVALLGIPGAASGGDGRAYRLRAGEIVGNVRVLEVQRTRILVEVEEFGVREQRVMELRMVNDPAPQEIFRRRELTEQPPDPPRPLPADTLEPPPGVPGGEGVPRVPGDTVEGGRE